MFSRSLQSPHLHYCGYNYVIVGYIMIIKQIRDELNAFDNWRLSSRQNHMGTWETLEIIKEMSRLKNSDVLVCSMISVRVTAAGRQIFPICSRAFYRVKTEIYQLNLFIFVSIRERERERPKQSINTQKKILKGMSSFLRSRLFSRFELVKIQI